MPCFEENYSIATYLICLPLSERSQSQDQRRKVKDKEGGDSPASEKLIRSQCQVLLSLRL